jgi:hypothetical protein
MRRLKWGSENFWLNLNTSCIDIFAKIPSIIVRTYTFSIFNFWYSGRLPDYIGTVSKSQLY